MLRLKHIPIRTFGENAAFIRQENLAQQRGIRQKCCLELRHEDRSVCAFLYPVTKPEIVALNEIGLDERACRGLDLPDGRDVEIKVIVPESQSLIQKKMAGDILTAGEYQKIAADIRKGCVSSAQIAGFITSFIKYSSLEEYSFLVASLIDENRFFWDDYALIADYRFIGYYDYSGAMELAVWLAVVTYGIPAPKVLTPFDGSLINYLSPMTDLRWSEESFQKILQKKRACIGLSESLDFCSVGMKILQMYSFEEIELPLYITILLALEASLGVRHFVIEIMIGSHSVIKSAAEALKLKNLAEYIARQVGIRLKVIISDESFFAENLKVEQVADILNQSSDCSSILCKNICRVAGQVLEFDPNLSAGDGYKIVQKLLQSGKIYDQFIQIMNGQAYYRRM